MKGEPTVAAMERRLAVIADRLDELEVEREQLYAERLGLWNEGVARGLTPIYLARCSRIRPVTVRALLARAQVE